MYIVASGMVCAAGLSAAAACTAMRAGIAAFDELPYRDDQGEPIIGSLVPDLDLSLQGEHRQAALLALALADCLEQAPTLATPQVPLLIACAEPERPGGQSLGQAFWQALGNATGRQFHAVLSRVVALGHTAGFEALRRARDCFQQDPQIEHCLVCGVDSLINARTLDWLEQHWRLKTSANSDGLIPGEAATAVLLARLPPTGQAGGSPPACAVTGLGFATEKATILSGEPLLGLGMAEAARLALAEARLNLGEIDFRLSDVSGEANGFKEQALMVSRLLRTRKEAFPLLHGADSIGDTGAAAGVGQLVAADHGWRKGYHPGPRALCCTGSWLGPRAVAVVRGDPPGDCRRPPATMVAPARRA